MLGHGRIADAKQGSVAYPLNFECAVASAKHEQLLGRVNCDDTARIDKWVCCKYSSTLIQSFRILLSRIFSWFRSCLFLI